MDYLAQKLRNLNTLITDRTVQSQAPYFAFGIFGLLNYPISFFYWSYINNPHYSSLILRLIATILCLGLVSKKYWPSRIAEYFSAYWYFVVFFSIPLFGTYLALFNNLSLAWIMNMSLGLFLFVLLVDWLSFIILLVAGTAAGMLLYVFFGGNLTDIPAVSWAYAGYMYLFALVIGGFFSRKNHIIKNLLIAEKRAEYNKQAAGSIAHDLRTPLTSIKFSMTALEHILPALIKGYDYAIEHGFKLEKPVRRQRIKNTVDSVKRNQKILAFANHYIDMVLGNLKHDSISTDNYRRYNVIETVNHALEVYPWDHEEKALLHWDAKVDFDFYGDDFYLQNILNNIIKNAMFYIKKAEKGEVFIWTDAEAGQFTLHIKDTALGAPAEVLKHMFDGYYSKREGGTGLGLAFCKSIMPSFGGSISASSVEGEYMEFVLRFPDLNNSPPSSQ